MTEKLGEMKNPLTQFDSKIHVILEGETDVAILSRLLKGLKGLENILFKPANGSNVDKLVEHNIGREEEAGEIVFGIVDRDCLFKDSKTLDDFLEPDNEAFRKKQHFGSEIGHRVRVLLRWELENYLILEPDAIARLNRDMTEPNQPLPPEDADSEDMLKKLIELGDSQVPLISMCARAVYRGEGHPVTHETWDLENLTREKLERQVRMKVGSAEEVEGEWREFERRVEILHAKEQKDLRIRWGEMNRLVDGKRILRQLCQQFRFDTFRSHIASNQERNPAVIQEWVDILNEFKRESRRIAAAKREPAF